MDTHGLSVRSAFLQVSITLRHRLYHILQKNESPILLIMFKFRGNTTIESAGRQTPAARKYRLPYLAPLFPFFLSLRDGKPVLWQFFFRHGRRLFPAAGSIPAEGISSESRTGAPETAEIFLPQPARSVIVQIALLILWPKRSRIKLTKRLGGNQYERSVRLRLHDHRR